MSAYDEVVRWLTLPEYAEWRDPNPERSKVTSIEHALQTAMLARHAGGTVDEVLCALVHDAARPLNDVFHGEVIAEVMRGRLDENLVEALHHHGAFQHDIIHGTHEAERLYRKAPWYRHALRLAVWDAHAFDPTARTEPIEAYLPLLKNLLAE